MATASVPDNEFRRTLRRRLIEEAERRPRSAASTGRRGRKGSVPYTALGVGIAVAGGGVAALAVQLLANASSVIAQGAWSPLG